jgi:hypothetical protein
MAPERALDKPEEEQASLRFQCESAQRMFADSAELLTKGMTFYLAITAAFLGYTFTQRLPGRLVGFILVAAIAISVLFLISCLATVAGILRTANTYRILSTKIGPQSIHPELSAMLTRWRHVTMIVTLCLVLLVSIFVAGIALFMHDYSGQTSVASPNPPSGRPDTSLPLRR